MPRLGSKIRWMDGELVVIVGRGPADKVVPIAVPLTIIGVRLQLVHWEIISQVFGIPGELTVSGFL